jgi:hypothetical protein
MLCVRPPAETLQAPRSVHTNFSRTPRHAVWCSCFRSTAETEVEMLSEWNVGRTICAYVEARMFATVSVLQ